MKKKGLRPLFAYLKNYKLDLLLGFFFLVLQNYGWMKVARYIQAIYDEVTGENRMATMLPYFWQLLAFACVAGVSIYLMRYWIIGVSRKIEYELRRDLFNHLILLDQHFYMKNQTGDLISRSTNDLNDVRSLLGPGIMYIPNSLSRFLFYTPVLFGLSAPLLGFVGIVVAVLIILVMVLMPRMRPLFKAVQEELGRINNRAWQIITGIHTIKVYTNEENELRRFDKLSQNYIDKNMKVARFRGLIWPILISLLMSINFFILLVGGREVIEGSMSSGQLLQFTFMIGQLTFPILSLGWAMTLIQQGLSAMERINNVLNEEHPGILDESEEKLTSPLTMELKNLSFIPPGSKTPIVKNISLKIKPGERIGITGTIGSGKTSLLHVLAGLYRPDPGQFFVNGKDISQMHPDALTSQLSLVLQEPFLFSMSVEDNIRFGSSDTHVATEEVEKLSRTAALHRDIDGFDKKYQEMVGERGVTLSGGQKQRLAIARALAKKTGLLLLDDSFSSIDAETEEEILAHIRDLEEDVTLVLVSHRVSALKLTQKVLVMDKGEIVEEGKPTELIKKDGLYAHLASLQQMESEIVQ